MLQMQLKNFKIFEEGEVDGDNFILNENENSELRNMEEDENDGDSSSLLDADKIKKNKRNYNDLDLDFLTSLYAPLNVNQNI